ncbi:RING-box protein hrt1 [Coemansia nantahalensis]|uniref:RING-box protein hrt1 n=2 Tax=Coemansia TaxID=4863 RepID=A0ACC1KU95_9FUNG|nr:RING-box protein hrt1 [Coemansia nantahalensis]KAJ2764171.1 RING-box protein hrt1 [Coemansia nantahalensis]KAJ2795205.1 RING-box protein hrt1 [Coemansia helicoidea]
MAQMDVDAPGDRPEGAAAADKPKAGAAAGKAKGPRMEIKKWTSVALWAWDMDMDVCAICRNNNMELCIECQADQGTKDMEECTLAWGICNHAFHVHCITRWLKSRNSCPLDNREWQYQKYGK